MVLPLVRKCTLPYRAVIGCLEEYAGALLGKTRVLGMFRMTIHQLN
jgi:hypothetical protein